jgi:hypothetical protein
MAVAGEPFALRARFFLGGIVESDLDDLALGDTLVLCQDEIIG